jgi:hypothetical protein
MFVVAFAVATVVNVSAYMAQMELTIRARVTRKLNGRVVVLLLLLLLLLWRLMVMIIIALISASVVVCIIAGVAAVCIDTRRPVSS